MSILSNKIFRITIYSILLAEFISFAGYSFPIINKVGFFIAAVICLVLSLYKLEYGIYFIISELIIGSKGYLFYFDAGGFSVSIRIAFWIIVMSIWSGKVLSDLFKGKGANIKFIKSANFKYFLPLFVFIIWGLINGSARNNSFNDLFFDFNGWLFFLLIFPIYSLTDNNFLKNLYQIILASMLWIVTKTFILLFIFSHSDIDTVFEIYRWVRMTGVGEITQILGGFYRIFFQSHIFVLIALFIALIILNKNKINQKQSNKKNIFLYFCFLVFLLSCIIISFSRSFWIGLAFGLFLLFFYLIKNKSAIKNILRLTGIFALSAIFSVIFITFIVKFPFPKPIGGFNTSDLIKDRISNINESAIVSRWDLLPKLWSEIKEAPILGKGYGATVSYNSSDPRIVSLNPAGEYTTYAFEWGWLDIWLKLGIGGVIAYLVLIFKIFISGIKDYSDDISAGLSFGVLIIAVVSIFSPYLNHPLGIGYIIITSYILDKNKKETLLKDPL